MSLRNISLKCLQTLGITIASTITFHPNSSVAQTTPSPITPDGTLPNNSRVRLEGNRITITDGTQAGSNLFHSFKNFSVPTGSEAFFNNNPDIKNIINRVTGGSISNIDGLIRANGSANLFLINPNGIVFGANARLDIGGSFYGTSANSMKFADGSEFSATNPQSTPLLTIDVPLGLQYGKNPGSIQVQGNGQGTRALDSPIIDTQDALRVRSDKTLALVGGEVNINGQRLRAPGGRIELGGLASTGTVGINNDGSLTFPEGVGRADVSLNRGEVDVSAGGRGSITVNAKNLEVTQGSLIIAGIASGFSTPESVAGDMTINATDTVLFDDSFAYNEVSDGGVGNAGGVSITTGSLEVLNGGQVSASTLGKGDAGSVTINANDLVKFDGKGQHGDLTGAFSIVGKSGVGKAGGVSITTGSLELLNGAHVSTSNFLGQGDAGSVTIKANDLVKFDGQGDLFPSGAFSVVFATLGKAGGVSITTGSLEVLNGAAVSASTLGEGNTGSVTIKANGLVKFDGQGPHKSPSEAFLRMKFLETFNGETEVSSIPTDDLNFNGGNVSASGFGAGNAGSVNINAKSISLDNNFQVNADTQSAGEDSQANINIRSQYLILRHGSNITTNAIENGGNINIDTGVLAGFEDSNIKADSENFRGGNIVINSEGVFGMQFRESDSPLTSDITATGANNQLSGNVTINTPEVDPTSALVELPVNLVDASNQISDPCAPGSSSFKDSFISTGRGGLPMTPTEPLQDTSTLSSWVRLKPQSPSRTTRKTTTRKTTTRKTSSQPKKVLNPHKVETRNQIVEATGWIVDADGNIEFVAQANQAKPKSPWQNSASCSASK